MLLGIAPMKMRIITTGGSGMRKGRPTQADVARAAGVSQTTVSIVLNKIESSNVRLSEATRRRVLDALDETGYVVNPIARSLAGHRTDILGVFGFEPLFGSNSESFYLPFMEGIEQAAEAAARDLLLFSSAARDGSHHHIYHRNENRLRLVDACVLIGNGEPRLELSRLAEENYPFVFIGRREVPGVDVPYVTVDYYSATIDVMRRLLSLGHRKVCYIAASRERDLPPSIERLDAVRDSFEELRLEGRIVFDDAESYRDELRSAIDHGATALVAEPLVDIEAVAHDLDARGLRIPADISVAVLGDPLNSARTSRLWSGYRLPRREMGHRAVEIAVALLDGPQDAERKAVMACIPDDGETVAAARVSAPEGDAA
jgi:DNA-binding LacI/PurR family transcriptional regulator